jgi:sugar phosphate isomerase/epimerase
MEYIEVYGDKLVNVHINDCTSKSSCLLPGSGNADLKGMIEKIKKINNSIPLIIEVYRQNFSRLDEVEISRKYIENMIK